MRSRKPKLEKSIEYLHVISLDDIFQENAATTWNRMLNMLFRRLFELKRTTVWPIEFKQHALLVH